MKYLQHSKTENSVKIQIKKMFGRSFQPSQAFQNRIFLDEANGRGITLDWENICS